MSLILEALRKSEAERRRGQAPGLFTPDANVLAPAAREKSPALAITIMLLLLVAIAYGAWRHWQGAPAPVTPATATQEASSTAATDSVAPRVTQESPVVTAAPTTASASASTPASTPMTPASPAMPATTASAPLPAAKTLMPPVRTMPPASLPVSTATPEAAASSEPSAVTLAALSTERRNQLPPLKLSMHVYAEDAGERFAIIDGQRITEGSTIGDAVVRAIRRDGVLLDVDGSSYLLPRP